MHSHLLFGALALALPALCLPSAPASSASADGPSDLYPINIAHFDAAFGVKRRAAEKLSSLDLQTQEQLIYGRHGGDGQLILANMTLYAEDGLQIVLMERFEGLTKSVDCKGDDGTMSLTFNSNDAFQYALKTWDFINQSEEKKFLLIANHNGCGPNDQRQPYLITNIREDAPTLTTFLTAQIAKWTEVVRTYDLDFGHALVAQSSSSQSRRGLIQDISNGLHGNFAIDKSKTFSVAVGTPNKASTVLDTTAAKIQCVNCFVTGSFTLAGHVSIKKLKLKELTLTGTPSGLAAQLELGSTITGGLHPDTLSYSKTLFSVPIPDAGIAVAGIFSLGAIISYDVGVSAAFSGSATVKYGLSASIPNNAKLVANLVTPSSSSATGFEGFQVTPVFDVTTLSAGVTLSAFSQPKLSFGLEITGIAKFDAAFAVKLPEVTATLTGGFNSAGLCAPGASKTGVNVSSSIGVEVDFDLNADVGGFKHDFTQKLFGTTHSLGAKCIPVSIPGLGLPHPVANAPPAIALPSGTVVPTVGTTSVGTAVPISTNGPKSGSAPVANAPPGVALPSGTAVQTAGTTSVGTAVPIQTTGPGNGTAPVVGRRVRLA